MIERIYHCRLLVIAGLAVWLWPPMLKADDVSTLQEQLRALDANVLSAADRAGAARTLQTEVSRRLKEANAESSRQWRTLNSRQEWEAFRALKLAALKKSLGDIPPTKGPPRTITAGSLNGEGFTVDKLLFESRPGVWVTANLYRPTDPKEPCPGILICHSHHNP
jgi:hypothetical protein